MLKAVRDGRLPARGHDRQPVLVRRAADVWHRRTSPAGWPPPGPRSYDYRVEWAPGFEPPLYPATDHWTVASSRSGLTAPVSGTLATLDLAVDRGHPARRRDRRAGRPDRPEPAGRGAVLGARPRRRDRPRWDGRRPDAARCRSRSSSTTTPTWSVGMPIKIPGVSTSSPRFVDLLGDGHHELLLATSDGEIHAYRSDMTELPGFPLLADVSPWWPSGSPTAVGRSHPDASRRVRRRRAGGGRSVPRRPPRDRRHRPRRQGLRVVGHRPAAGRPCP